MELRDIRDCENETYGCKKEKGIIVENMEEKVYTTPYGKFIIGLHIQEKKNNG